MLGLGQMTERNCSYQMKCTQLGHSIILEFTFNAICVTAFQTTENSTEHKTDTNTLKHNKTALDINLE